VGSEAYIRKGRQELSQPTEEGGEKLMKLLTKEIVKRFAEVGSQEDVKDPIVIVKFFNPTGTGTWFATEYDPEERMFFGYVSLFNDYNNEFGYFSLDELESYQGKFGLGIERDMYGSEMTLNQWKNLMGVV